MLNSLTIVKKAEVAFRTTEIVFKTTRPFAFIAGQYVTITLPGLKNLPPKEQFRDFSIASPPEDGEYISIALRRSESPFKKELLRDDRMPEVIMEGPKGVFILPERLPQPVVFIAGGIGITPFLSIMRHLRAAHIPLRPTLFFYNKSRETAPYLNELEAPESNANLISNFGPMTEKEVVERLPTLSSDALWYIAGPRGFVRKAREVLTHIKIGECNIKSEEFSGYE